MFVPSRHNGQGRGIVMERVMKEGRTRGVTLAYSPCPSNSLPFTPLLVVMISTFHSTLHVKVVNDRVYNDYRLFFLAHYA